MCRLVTNIHHQKMPLSALKWKPAYQGFIPADHPSVSCSGVGNTTHDLPAINKAPSAGGMTHDGMTPGGMTQGQPTIDRPAFIAAQAIPPHRALPPLRALSPLPNKAGRVVSAFNLAAINEACRPDPKILPAIHQSLNPDRPTAISSGIAPTFTPRHPAAIAANMASSFTPINKPAGSVGQVAVPRKTTTLAGDIANAKAGSKIEHSHGNGSQVANAKTQVANKETPISQGSMVGEVNKAASNNGTATTTATKIRITRATASMTNNNNGGEPRKPGNSSNGAAAATTTVATGSSSSANSDTTNPAATEDGNEDDTKNKRTPLPTSRPNTARVLQATAMAASAALVPRGGPWSYPETIRLLVLRVRGLSAEQMALVCLRFCGLFNFEVFVFLAPLPFLALLPSASLVCLLSFLAFCASGLLVCWFAGLLV